MELWIRSQDKEILVKTKGFELQHPSYDGGCQIFAVWQNNYQCVGNYKTKERALEILDEIQNILKPKLESRLQPSVRYEDNKIQTTYEPYNFYVNSSIQELSTYVYNMPKE